MIEEYAAELWGMKIDYVDVEAGESKNNATFARMCNVMAKDEKTFIGQAPGDYTGYKLAEFDDETGEFTNAKEKAWEGNPHE